MSRTWGITRIVRLVLIGRSNGIRARIRRRILRRGARPEPETHAEKPPEKPADPLADVALPAGFHAVIDKRALQPGEITEVIAGGTPVALCNVDGRFFAVSNVCPHAGGPIGDGAMAEHTVTCPYHGWSFDVRSGKCFVNADVTLPTYETKVVGDAVCVKV